MISGAERLSRHGQRFLNLINIFVVLIGLVLAGCGQDHPQSTIDPATRDFGPAIQDLYLTVFWWTMFILAVVWTVLAYVLVRFREREGGPEPKKTRGHLGLEIGWTAGAAVIVVLITIPTIRTVFRTQAQAGPDALVVEVIGHQWWWEFRYPEQEIVTANELHLPVGRQVDLRMWSADVIHSFWIPRFGGKRDVNPLVREPDGTSSINRLTFTVDEPGVYQGQCAEFCGASHTLMGIRAVVVSESEFQDWAQSMASAVEPDSGSLAARGRDAFMTSTCIACHAIAGTNARGALGPSLTRLESRMTIAAGLLENTTANLVEWINDPARIKPGARMPGVTEGGGGFPATALSPEQVEAIAAYLSGIE